MASQIKKSISVMRDRYRITAEQYLKLWDRCGGRCEICRRELKSTIAGDSPGQSDSGLAQLDHCHKTGVVRGILCRACNQWLGKIGDSPEAGVRASAYLTADCGFEHIEPLSTDQLAAADFHSGRKTRIAKQFGEQLKKFERAAWASGDFRYLCGV